MGSCQQVNIERQKKTKEMILYFDKSIDKNVIPTLVVGDCRSIELMNLNCSVLFLEAI